MPPALISRTVVPEQCQNGLPSAIVDEDDVLKVEFAHVMLVRQNQISHLWRIYGRIPYRQISQLAEFDRLFI